ncbi:MAG: YdcF family protein [Sandaracinaceae bacterium]
MTRSDHWRRIPIWLVGMLVWIGGSSLGCTMPVGTELFVPATRPLHADAIVVLGNRPPRGPDGEIAPESERRVRRGVELFQAGLAPEMVMAGGPAPGGGTESEVMAAYARSLGVPAEAIRLEQRSRDTAENARYTLELLCGGQDECQPNVLVVTAPYHLRRALVLFECAGANAMGVPTEIPDDLGYQLGFAVYEYAAGVLGLLTDTCSSARGSQEPEMRTP